MEVNGETLVGMDHLSAVNIIRGLPEHVVLVCARLRGLVEAEPESILESVTEVPKPRGRQSYGITVSGIPRSGIRYK